MSFSVVTNSIFDKYPRGTQRFLEILPGAVSWFLITFPVWGSLIIPEIVAYYIIGFNVYWLYRSFRMAILAIFAHFKINASQRYDWMKDVTKFDEWHKLRHIVVIPTYKEPVTTLRRTLKALAQQTFSPEKITVMISFEEREGDQARKKAEKLQREFGGVFDNLAVTYHPDIEGEVKGKSSNMSWGARKAKRLVVDEKGADIDWVTITSQDADSVLHPQYFAVLSFQFLKSRKRYRRIWQAGIMFYNNIWRVPAPIRVMASVFSVFQLYVLMRPDSLMNFSTYSTSLKLVDKIGYWDTDVIPEDYRMFFKAYFATKGQITVEPMFIPIYSDAAESEGYWSTMVNQYEQIKRWAWGASDDAYIIKQWLTVPTISRFDKTMRVLHVLEAHFLWPVNWFAITVGALIPPLINPEFSRTILGKTLPQVSSTILTVSLISLVVIFVIDAANRPPRPNQVSWLKKLLQPLEFVLMPVVGFFFSALPGLDAHTRLLLGKYIEYRVTHKV